MTHSIYLPATWSLKPASLKELMLPSHLITVDGIIKVWAFVIASNPVADQLVSVDAVILPLISISPSFFQAENPSVETTGLLNIMNRNCKMEGVSGSRFGGGTEAPALCVF